ncbi:MAG: BPTI/Kunitz domain-containing protein [Bacteroidia bacterium]|nr:BPTI/Kunitz domain-containing protein [Bacteroidia bacterium]
MKKNIYSLLFFAFCLIFLSQCKKSTLTNERCMWIPDPGPCEAYIPKYYYDQDEKKCKEFIYGGCAGVVPFDTEEECKQACGCK